LCVVTWEWHGNCSDVVDTFYWLPRKFIYCHSCGVREGRREGRKEGEREGRREGRKERGKEGERMKEREGGRGIKYEITERKERKKKKMII
jgi:hypothetical protein